MGSRVVSVMAAKMAKNASGLPAENAQKRLPLPVIRPCVDEELAGAVPFMQGSGERLSDAHVESVQDRVS